MVFLQYILSRWAQLDSVFLWDSDLQIQILKNGLHLKLKLHQLWRTALQLSQECWLSNGYLVITFELRLFCYCHFLIRHPCILIPKKIIGFTHASSKVHNFPLHGRTNILLVNYDSCWQHQMLVHKLRHDRPSGQFSKSGGMSASVSFLSYSPLPRRSFTCTIFHTVFDFHSSFFSPKPHRNACYAGIVIIAWWEHCSVLS